jgi:hypothetical protein
MKYCSPNAFCCLDEACECLTGFNVLTFNESAEIHTIIGTTTRGATATSSSSASTTDSLTSTGNAVDIKASTTTDTPIIVSSATASGIASSRPFVTPSPSDGGLSTGAKVGIAVIVAFVVLLFVVVGFLIRRAHHQRKELARLRARHQPMTSGPSEINGVSTSRLSKGARHSSSITPGDPPELNGLSTFRLSKGAHNSSTRAPSDPLELNA